MPDRPPMIFGNANIAQVAALLDSMPVALVIVDAGGQIISANERTERLFGHGRGALQGGSV